jgi:hypothetical protein
MVHQVYQEKMVNKDHQDLLDLKVYKENLDHRDHQVVMG